MLGLIHGWPIVGSVWTRNGFDYDRPHGREIAPGEQVTVTRVAPIDGGRTVMVRYIRNKNGVKQYGWYLDGFLERYVCSSAELPWIGEGI